MHTSVSFSRERRLNNRRLFDVTEGVARGTHSSRQAAGASWQRMYSGISVSNLPRTAIAGRSTNTETSTMRADRERMKDLLHCGKRRNPALRCKRPNIHYMN
jgi:hypothetical protein